MNKTNIFKMTSLPVKLVKWAFDFASWQPTESQILQAFSCIQLEEKERIGHLLFKRDVKASLIGRLLIRKFLAENSGIKYNDLILKRNDRGKPFVVNEVIKGKLNFSVSHHGRLVIFVGEIGGVDVGVDVMTTKYTGGKDLNEFFRLMSRHFSSSEWDVIKYTSALDSIRMILFNRHWALKESYLKAVGVGITVDLKTIEFRIKTKFLCAGDFVNDTELYINQIKQENWLFQETLLHSDHIIAIAIHSKLSVDLNPFKFMDFNELTDNSLPLLKEDLSFCREFLEKDEEPY